MLIQNECKMANREELQVVIPVRIDCGERLRNLRLVLHDLSVMGIPVIVLEADKRSHCSVLLSSFDFDYIFVGDGNYDGYFPLCRDYLGKITFTGKVDKELLSVFYQISDVGVMPSFHEQCSYVAIEMMAYGLPLIGTDTTGLKEMLELEDEYSVPIAYAEDEMESLIDVFAERILAVLSSGQYKKRRDESWKYDLDNVKLSLISFYLRM